MCVKVSDSFSQTATVTIGAPQGSVLGPSLFLVYMNHAVSFLNSGLMDSEFSSMIKSCTFRTMSLMIRLGPLCSIIVTYSLALANHGVLMSMPTNVL